MPFILGSLNNLMLFLSCNSVYFPALLTMSIVCFVVYELVARGYQRREREDTKCHQNYSETIIVNISEQTTVDIFYSVWCRH